VRVGNKISVVLLGLTLLALQAPVAAQDMAFTLPASTAKVTVPKNSDFPQLVVNGDVFNPSGWVASHTLSIGFGTLRKEMDQCVRQGYECFLLRVGWRSIEPVEGGMRLDTLQRVLSYADTIGLKVIVGLEFDIAPAWFVERYPEAVSLTKYIDEQLDIIQGDQPRNALRGRLILNDGRGVIGFHWLEQSPFEEEPELYKKVRLFWEDTIKALYHQCTSHESFIAWGLNTPAAPLGYAGGGIEGILGMADFSDARRDAYFEAKGAEIPDPLIRYSQGSPDERAEWLDFSLFRITSRRSFIDFVGKEIKNADAYHPVFFYPGEILSYVKDNGYLAECEALDWGYYVKQRYIDGVIIPFQISPYTFAQGCHPGKGELIPLQAAIGVAIRFGKLPLVWVENSKEPPSVADVRAFAAWLKVVGACPLYSHPVRYTTSERWGLPLTKEIELASVNSLLPLPKKRQPRRVAVLDFPFLFGKYYAEKDNSLANACIQLEIFNQAGIPYDLVDAGELIDDPSILDNYRVMMPLTIRMLESEFFNDSRVQIAFQKFKDRRGVFFTPQPIKVQEFAEGGFNDINFIEETRVEFVKFGCETNQAASPDLTVAVAEPYIFAYPHRYRYDAYLHVYIGRWSMGAFKVLHFLEILTGRKLTCDVFNRQLRMDLDLYGGRPYLYAETESVMDVLDVVREKRNMVSIYQTEAELRRFVPVSLAVCFIMLLLLAFYSFHGQKELMQQKARRIERGMQLEEFDVVELDRLKRQHYIKLLGSADVVKRIVAAAALGDMGEDAREALPILRSMLNSEDPYFEKALREAISKIEGYG